MSAAGWITERAATLVPRLSFPAASSLGRGLGAVAWAFDARHRHVAESNLARVFPETPASRRRDIGRRAFEQAGRNVVETLWSSALDDGAVAEIASFEGCEHVDAALAAGRGALLTTAHFGNWELMGLALAQRGVPLNVIARPVADPALEGLLLRLRTRTGARVIPKADAVRAALKALRDGESVGILIDQNTVREQAAFVPFCGRLAATTRLTAQLHLRTGAPIIMSFCVPSGDGYRFVFEPLRPGSGAGTNEEQVEELTAAATAQIERWVRRHPEAWLWIHDRWRTRPPGEEEVTPRSGVAPRPASGSPVNGASRR